jgi:hypothetical protein
MMQRLRGFLDDERGTTSMVIRLVLAVTIGAAVLVVLLQMLHVNQDTAKISSGSIQQGAKKGLGESMKYLTD